MKAFSSRRAFLVDRCVELGRDFPDGATHREFDMTFAEIEAIDAAADRTPGTSSSLTARQACPAASSASTPAAGPRSGSLR